MDLLLFSRLFFSLFSVDPKNMRWFNWKRLLMSLLLLPVFTVNMVGNRLFMMLDYVFFFRFRFQKVDKAIFIVAVPRSATTFLFHKLAEEKKKITAMKLWEISYAPSICQKYMVLGILKVDKAIGHPLKKMVLWLESKILGDFKKIHHMSLNLPEEDEAILLWYYSTVYLNFFYPDTMHFDDYFRFDDQLSEKKRMRIMRWYYRCVQRHCFVFNRNGEKYFMSKNPAFMSKIKTLHAFFPNAVMYNINRCPSKTIPSTMNLSNAAYGFFTSRKASPEINERTKRVVIDWYKMGHHYLSTLYANACVEIDFKKLVKLDADTMDRICKPIGLDKKIFEEKEVGGEKESHHQNKTTYPTLSAEETEEVLKEIPFMRRFSNYS